jgi:hypothetical protein
MLVRGTKDKVRAMAEALKNSIAFVGIDIGKNSFHIAGLNECGAIVLRQKWSRRQVEARFANMPPCLIGMEAMASGKLFSEMVPDARVYISGKASSFFGDYAS